MPRSASITFTQYPGKGDVFASTVPASIVGQTTTVVLPPEAPRGATERPAPDGAQPVTVGILDETTERRVPAMVTHAVLQDDGGLRITVTYPKAREAKKK